MKTGESPQGFEWTAIGGGLGEELKVAVPAGVTILDSQLPLILGVRPGAYDVPELLLLRLISKTP